MHRQWDHGLLERCKHLLGLLMHVLPQPVLTRGPWSAQGVQSQPPWGLAEYVPRRISPIRAPVSYDVGAQVPGILLGLSRALWFAKLSYILRVGPPLKCVLWLYKRHAAMDNLQVKRRAMLLLTMDGSNRLLAFMLSNGTMRCPMTASTIS